jgi:hypothetical protein
MYGVSTIQKFLSKSERDLASLLGGTESHWERVKSDVQAWLSSDEPKPPKVDRNAIVSDLEALKRQRASIDSKTAQLDSELESLAKTRIGLSARIRDLEAALR